MAFIPSSRILPRKDLREGAFRKYENFIAIALDGSYEYDPRGMTPPMSATTFIARFNDARLAFKRYGYYSTKIKLSPELDQIKCYALDNGNVAIINELADAMEKGRKIASNGVWQPEQSAQGTEANAVGGTPIKRRRKVHESRETLYLKVATQKEAIMADLKEKAKVFVENGGDVQVKFSCIFVFDNEQEKQWVYEQARALGWSDEDVELVDDDGLFVW